MNANNGIEDYGKQIFRVPESDNLKKLFQDEGTTFRIDGHIGPQFFAKVAAQLEKEKQPVLFEMVADSRFFPKEPKKLKGSRPKSLEKMSREDFIAKKSGIKKSQSLEKMPDKEG